MYGLYFLKKIVVFDEIGFYTVSLKKNIIHSSAIVNSKAKIGNGVFIGPFCCIGPDVVLGDRVHLVSHINLDGIILIGEDSIIYPFASLGQAPQDLKFSGERSKTIIGKRCKIREYVTIQAGTRDDRMKTIIGNNCLLMVGVHIAHDCVVGNNVVMANNVTLAGHVKIGDNTILGGLVAVHQFVQIGSYAMIGGTAAIGNNVIPYGFVKGNHSTLDGLNIIGMKRHGLKRNEILQLLKVYREIFEKKDKTLSDRLDISLKKFPKDNRVIELIDFIINSVRPLCLPKYKSSYVRI